MKHLVSIQQRKSWSKDLASGPNFGVIGIATQASPAPVGNEIFGFFFRWGMRNGAELEEGTKNILAV